MCKEVGLLREHFSVKFVAAGAVLSCKGSNRLAEKLSLLLAGVPLVLTLLDTYSCKCLNCYPPLEYIEPLLSTLNRPISSVSLKRSSCPLLQRCAIDMFPVRIVTDSCDDQHVQATRWAALRRRRA